MHVCDVDHVSPVAHTYIITRSSGKPPDTYGQAESEQVIAGMEPIVLELSEKAATALEQKDWAALAALVPENGRSKNPARVAGAKKGAQTRAAKKAQATDTPHHIERPDLYANSTRNNAMVGAGDTAD